VYKSSILRRKSASFNSEFLLEDFFMESTLDEDSKDQLLERIQRLEEKECVVSLPSGTRKERKRFLALMLDRFELPTLTCVDKKNDTAVCLVAGANSLKRTSNQISSTFSSTKIDFAREFLEKPEKFLAYKPKVSPKPENVFVGASIYTAQDQRSLGLATRALSISLKRAKEMGAAYYIEGYPINPMDYAFQRVLDKLDFISPVIEIPTEEGKQKVFDMKWLRENQTLGLSMLLRLKVL
jgi:hypothetical protein